MKPSIKMLWIARGALLVCIWVVLAILHFLDPSR